MKNLNQVAMSVNVDLCKISIIHDEIFNLDFRKVVPLPFISKRPDHLNNIERLTTILGSFDDYRVSIFYLCEKEIEDKNECILFTEYLDKLECATEMLVIISNNLYLRSQGMKIDPKVHCDQCDKYFAAMESYIEAGNQINPRLILRDISNI